MSFPLAVCFVGVPRHHNNTKSIVGTVCKLLNHTGCILYNITSSHTGFSTISYSRREQGSLRARMWSLDGFPNFQPATIFPTSTPTHSATQCPPSCWQTAQISSRCQNGWDTQAWTPPKAFIPTSLKKIKPRPPNILPMFCWEEGIKLHAALHSCTTMNENGVQ